MPDKAEQNTRKLHNIVVRGITEPETAPVVRRLVEEECINLVAWFGRVSNTPGCTHPINGLYDYDPKTSVVSDALFDYVFKDIYTFMDMYSRSNRDSSGNHIRYRDFHEFADVFNQHLYFHADLLVKNNVDTVIFGNLPHLGADFILYKVAKFLGLRTILLQQFPFYPGKFLVLEDIADFSIYKHLPPKPMKERMTLKKREVPIYMVGYQNTAGYDLKALGYSLFKDIGKLLLKADCTRLLGKVVYVMKYLDYREYQKNLVRLTVHQIEWDKPFVYVPLHLQPELTTASLGGPYTDQALAIERLARLVPNDWMIYIKENPKQSEYKRGPDFFKRIARIPNARFVSGETNTFDLSERCRFVATISGTAGWEAIQIGKPALIFGSAWYEGFPGVFRYHDQLTLDEILSCQIHSDDVESAVNDLVSKLEDGVIYNYYIRLMTDFNPVHNAELVAKALLSKIQKSEGLTSSCTVSSC